MVWRFAKNCDVCHKLRLLMQFKSHQNQNSRKADQLSWSVCGWRKLSGIPRRKSNEFAAALGRTMTMTMTIRKEDYPISPNSTCPGKYARALQCVLRIVRSL